MLLAAAAALAALKRSGRVVPVHKHKYAHMVAWALQQLCMAGCCPPLHTHTHKRTQQLLLSLTLWQLEHMAQWALQQLCMAEAKHERSQRVYFGDV